MIPVEYDGVYWTAEVGVIGKVTVWGEQNCARNTTEKNSDIKKMMKDFIPSSSYS